MEVLLVQNITEFAVSQIIKLRLGIHSSVQMHQSVGQKPQYIIHSFIIQYVSNGGKIRDIHHDNLHRLFVLEAALHIVNVGAKLPQTGNHIDSFLRTLYHHGNKQKSNGVDKHLDWSAGEQILD